MYMYLFRSYTRSPTSIFTVFLFNMKNVIRAHIAFSHGLCCMVEGLQVLGCVTPYDAYLESQRTF